MVVLQRPRDSEFEGARSHGAQVGEPDAGLLGEVQLVLGPTTRDLLPVYVKLWGKRGKIG